MATIKSYATIEQSRKLAEILPIESADMYYFLDPTPAGNIYHLTVQRVDVGIKNLPQYDEGDIPCWSLAALLGVLPDNYIDVNDTIYHPNLMKTKDGRYMVIYNVSQYTSLCNNPIDACYEMIIRLNELKVL